MSPTRASAASTGAGNGSGRSATRQHESDQRRKGGDLLQHRRARGGRVAGVGGGDEDADRGERQVGAELVDQQPETEAVSPVQRLDHRQADERGVAEPADKRQRADAGARQAQPAAEAPERCRADREKRPRHEHRPELVRIEREAVQRAQRDRGKRHVEDDGVEGLVGIGGGSRRVLQQHSDGQAGDEKNEVRHGRLRRVGATAPVRCRTRRAPQSGQPRCVSGSTTATRTPGCGPAAHAFGVAHVTAHSTVLAGRRRGPHRRTPAPPRFRRPLAPVCRRRGHGRDDPPLRRRHPLRHRRRPGREDEGGNADRVRPRLRLQRRQEGARRGRVQRRRRAARRGDRLGA